MSYRAPTDKIDTHKTGTTPLSADADGTEGMFVAWEGQPRRLIPQTSKANPQTLNPKPSTPTRETKAPPPPPFTPLGPQ